MKINTNFPTMKFIVSFTSMILFSSIFVGVAYGSIYLDKEVYTWTDKVHIRITEHGLDADESSVRIYTSNHELKNYKLSKAGNGLYTGEVILTGFLHDVDGDGKPDTTPRTTGSGPNNGFLETKRDGGFTISVKFADGDVMSKSAKISWNEGNIIFDMPNYTPNESAKLQVADADMNLNPETLDVIKVHVFSDSDKAGILVNAIETQEESGLFETTVSFTQDRASSGNRLFAVSGDMIYAQYNDHTLPVPYGINDDLEIIAESTIKIDSQSSQKTILDDDVIMNTTDELSIKIESNNNEKNIKSPLKQFKEGVEPSHIICREELELVFKSSDDSSACVKPETLVKLLARGWTNWHDWYSPLFIDNLRQGPQDVDEVHAEFVKREVMKDSKVAKHFLREKNYDYTCCSYLYNDNDEPPKYQLVINFSDLPNDKQLVVVYDLRQTKVVETKLKDMIQLGGPIISEPELIPKDDVKSTQEHYKIEITGLKDVYLVGERYDFSYIISGYGHPCGGKAVTFPDSDGDTMTIASSASCIANLPMGIFVFDIQKEYGTTYGHIELKNPGTYTVTVTFDRPSQYFPTTVSKEFRVTEK